MTMDIPSPVFNSGEGFTYPSLILSLTLTFFYYNFSVVISVVELIRRQISSLFCAFLVVHSCFISSLFYFTHYHKGC